MTVVNGKKIQDLKGTVVSDKSDKTIVVVCENVRKHPLYKKRYVKQKKFFAHDEENKASEGDEVVIMQDNPRSKNKRWKLKEIL